MAAAESPQLTARGQSAIASDATLLDEASRNATLMVVAGGEQHEAPMQNDHDEKRVADGAVRRKLLT